MIRNGVFNFSVYLTVTIIGCLFGAWAGLIYGNEWSWPFIGVILGATGGIGVSWLYIYSLEKIFLKNISNFALWLFGSLIAGLCGLLCTSFIHGVLMLIYTIFKGKSFLNSGDIPGSIILMVAEIIGLLAGFITSVVFSAIYLKTVKADK